MRMIATGRARACYLAELIPRDTWEKGLVLFCHGPLIEGLDGPLETFLFETRLSIKGAQQLMSMVIDKYPPSPETKWNPGDEWGTLEETIDDLLSDARRMAEMEAQAT